MFGYGREEERLGENWSKKSTHFPELYSKVCEYGHYHKTWLDVMACEAKEKEKLIEGLDYDPDEIDEDDIRPF